MKDLLKFIGIISAITIVSYGVGFFYVKPQEESRKRADEILSLKSRVAVNEDDLEKLKETVDGKTVITTTAVTEGDTTISSTEIQNIVQDLGTYVTVQATTGTAEAQEGDIAITGSVIAGAISGDGALVTDIDADNITAGTLSTGRYSAYADLLAESRIGTGGGFDADLLDGRHAASFLLLSGGTMTGNITWNSTQTFSNATQANLDTLVGGGVTALHSHAGGGLWADNGTYIYPTNVGTTFQVLDAGGLTVPGTVSGTLFSGSGASLTSLNATNLSSGTVPSARVSGSYTSITGVGTITTGVWNGTDIAVADGGTGASTAAGARTNLGLDAAGAGDIWVEKAGDAMSGAITGSTGYNGLVITPNTGEVTTGTWNAGAVTSSGAVQGTTLTATTAASGLVLGSGANATTFSSGATIARAVTFPDAAGTVTVLGNTSTGTGAVVLQSSPTLTTPNIGAASGTSLALTGAITGSTGYNGLVITADTGVITTGTWNGTALTDAYVSDTLTSSLFVGSGSTTTSVDLATAEVAGIIASGNVSGSYTGITGLGTITTGVWNAGAVTSSGDITVGAGNRLILGSKADPDPSGTAGAMYYNTTSSKFRCYEGAAWTDCISAGGSGDITAVGSMTSGAAFADATADNDWLGLGASVGRIEFDDLATDEVNILGANVGIGTASPEALLDIGGYYSHADVKAQAVVTGAKGNFVGIPTYQLTVRDSSALAAGVGGAIAFDGNYTGTTGTVFASIEGVKSNATDANYAGELRFYTRVHGGNNTQKMVIDTGGNVGIGTTAPQSSLDIASGHIVLNSTLENWDTNYNVIQFGTGASFASYSAGVANMFFNSNAYFDGSNWKYQTTDEAAQLWLQDGKVRFRSVTSGTADTNITWTTPFTIEAGAGTNSLYVNSSGNVGIGTENPDELLHLESAVSWKPDLKIENTNADSGAPGLRFFANSVGSAADNDYTGIISFDGLDDLNNTERYAYITSRSTDVSNGAEKGVIDFATRNAGSDATVVMRIDATGNVGIGTTSPGALLALESSTADAAAITLRDTSGAGTRGGNIYGSWGLNGLVIDTLIGDSATHLYYGSSSGYVDQHHFYINGAEKMTIDNAGNVGIGDTTPDGLLDVESTGAVTTTNYGINLSNLTTNTTTDGINKYGAYITSTGSFTGLGGTATNNYGLYVDTPTGADNNYAAIFEGGNVGIGTTSPGVRLDIKSSGTAADITRVLRSSDTNPIWKVREDGTGNGIVQIFDSSNNADINLNTASDVYFNNAGNVGIGTTSPDTNFMIYESNTDTVPALKVENFSTGDAGIWMRVSNALSWYAGIDNSDSDKFKIGGGGIVGNNSRFTIDTSGNVGIGTTSPDSIKLDVQDDIEVGTGTTGCVRDEDNTTIAGTCVSDIRLKENINPLGNSLDKLLGFNPVTFDWKDGSNQTPNYGLISQEVFGVAPELVRTDSKGYLRVSYDTSLTMMTIKGIQEQQEQIDNLKQGLAVSNTDTTQLEQRIAVLESQVQAQSSTGNILTAEQEGVLAMFSLEDDGKTLVINENLKVGGDLEVAGAVKFADDSRGYNVEVAEGETSLEILFTTPRANVYYAVNVTPSWITNVAVTEKRLDGFKVEFGTEAPLDSKVDWILVE